MPAEPDDNLDIFVPTYPPSEGIVSKNFKRALTITGILAAVFAVIAGTIVLCTPGRAVVHTNITDYQPVSNISVSKGGQIACGQYNTSGADSQVAICWYV